MTAIQDLVDRNARRWGTRPGGLASPPSLRIAVVAEATGLRPTWAVETFRHTESDVRQSVERVRRSPFLANTTAVRGFVVDVETGDLAEVLPAQP